MIIREHKRSVIYPCNIIRSLDRIVGKGPHVDHGITAHRCLEQFNCRVRSNYGSIEWLSSNWVKRGAVIDQQYGECISVGICSDVHSMEIQSTIAFDAMKVLSRDPFNAGRERSISSSVEDSNSICEATALSIERSDAERRSVLIPY